MQLQSLGGAAAAGASCFGCYTLISMIRRDSALFSRFLERQEIVMIREDSSSTFRCLVSALRE